MFNYFKFTFLIIIFICSSVYALSIQTISESIKNNQIKTNTGKITSIIKVPNHSQMEQEVVTVKDKEYILHNKDRFSKNVLYYDNSNKIKRLEEKDLTASDLKPEQKFYLDFTSTQITQNDSILNYFPSAKCIMMDISRNTPDMEYAGVNNYRYGYVMDSWLTIDDPESVNISENIEKGQKVIIVESSVNNKKNNIRRIVKLAPDFGYRCLELNEFKDDQLVREVKYDNYKKYDGYYLPELYSNKRYSNGKLLKEIEIFIENANFDIDFDKDISSIEVPKGTMVAGRSLNPDYSLNTWYTKKPRTLTIDEIYEHDMDELADKEMENLYKTNQKKNEEKLFFLQKISSTVLKNKIIAFNFDKYKIFDIDIETSLQDTIKSLSKDNNSYLLFDGDFITIGNFATLDENLRLKSKDKFKSVYSLKEQSFPMNIRFEINNKLYNILINKIDEKGLYFKVSLPK